MDAQSAASALQWWADAGVDTLVGDTARDWLSYRSAQASPPAEATPPQQQKQEMPMEIGQFRAWLAGSGQLPLASPSAPRVLPSGDEASGLMILTDMPSAEDCASGTLLSGDAGLLFDRMLAAIGRDWGSVYLASLSCLRAPEAVLDDAATSECANITRHHIGIAAPKALLMFGDVCSKALTGLPMAQARGRWHEIETPSGPVKALATLSPDYLLQQPAQKKLAWADLQLLMEGLPG